MAEALAGQYAPADVTISTPRPEESPADAALSSDVPAPSPAPKVVEESAAPKTVSKDDALGRATGLPQEPRDEHASEAENSLAVRACVDYLRGMSEAGELDLPSIFIDADSFGKWSPTYKHEMIGERNGYPITKPFSPDRSGCCRIASYNEII